jgi:predicted nuclease with TOPRIM domain
MRLEEEKQKRNEEELNAIKERYDELRTVIMAPDKLRLYNKFM